MADSSFDNLTPLARALSHPKLDEGTEACPPLHTCRRRKLLSCKSTESVEPATSPSAVTEARVLVLNTGGTIGMTIHDDGTYT